MKGLNITIGMIALLVMFSVGMANGDYCYAPNLDGFRQCEKAKRPDQPAGGQNCVIIWNTTKATVNASMWNEPDRIHDAHVWCSDVNLAPDQELVVSILHNKTYYIGDKPYKGSTLQHTHQMCKFQEGQVVSCQAFH